MIQGMCPQTTLMASQEKVLIVEDELHALTGLAELVSGWGYRTDTARDGVEALERVQAWQPGIVVTDLKMPRMDGLELLERLNELNQDQAVVVLTAQGSIELAVEAMKMGAYDFIQKPVDPTRLRTILLNATRQRETERELEVTRRKLRDTGVLGSMVGLLEEDAGAVCAGGTGCAFERVGADYGRERNGQGDGGANAA